MLRVGGSEANHQKSPDKYSEISCKTLRITGTLTVLKSLPVSPVSFESANVMVIEREDV